jgi:DNA-directed RNA polymerase subunit RPC12/RpoP
MSQRTWVCVPCGRTDRRPQDVPAVRCSKCGRECEYVHWKIRVPSPKHPKRWAEFWAKYRAEKALLDAWSRGELTGVVRLDILNADLDPSGRAPTNRKEATAWTDRRARRRSGGRVRSSRAG